MRFRNITMRQCKLYSIGLFFAGLYLLVGCQDDELVNRSSVDEGVPVTAVFSFSSENKADVAVTKSALSTAVEFKVYDMYVFVFKNGGSLEKGLWYDNSSIASITESEKTDDASVTAGKISMKITSGRKQIFAVANVGSDATLLASLKAITTVNQLKELKASVINADAPTYRGNGRFFMSGSYNAAEDQHVSYTSGGNVTVNIDGSLSTTGKIYFSHLDSRITFNITTSVNGVVGDASKETPTSITFIPKGYRIVNVPTSCYLFERPMTTESHDSGPYSATGVVNDYTGFDELTQSDGSYYGGDFTFYMFENRKSAKAIASNYADRERQDKDANGLNGAFTYANADAAYVEIVGAYHETYTQNGVQKEKTADVKYTIHLGYLGSDANDYKSERNCNYTYTVTIKGVDNIELEVTSSQQGETFTENQPGAEGAVVKADKFYYVDAHYVEQSVTFTKKSIDDNSTFMVKTPYDNYGKGSSAVDYKWVTFVQNRKKGDGVYSSDFVSFPRDETKRLDVSQVIAKLISDKENTTSSSIYDKEGNAVFTMFVDEYYYDYDPRNTQKIVPWTDFVNGANREMYIICNTLYSKDTKSSLTSSAVAIIQKPIRTFYSSSMTTGWGVESENEVAYTDHDGSRLPIKNSTVGKVLQTDYRSNGRYNTFQNIHYSSTSSWNTFVDPATNYIKEVTNIALLQMACLQRNRDLNGDGIIQPNEIRWYMPAVNQLTGLFIGRDVIPNEVQLFQNGTTVTRDERVTNSGNYRKFHFTNSNNIQFWAEEGAATGSDYMNDGYWDYRCVRNIGVNYNIKTSAPTTTPEVSDYAVKKVEGSSIYIDLSAVNPKALRSTSDNGFPLAVTNELSEYNRPYTSFYVASEHENTLVYKEAIYNNSYTDPCPSGWRMPNMRELTLMAAYGGNTSTSDPLLSNTYSSLSYKMANHIIYNWSKDIITLGDLTSGYVRCVRDK